MARRPWTMGLAAALAAGTLMAGASDAQARHPRRWVDGTAVAAKSLSALGTVDQVAVLTTFTGEAETTYGIACTKTKKGLACAAVDQTGKVLDDSVRYQARQTPRGLELAFMVELSGVQLGVQSSVGPKARKGVSKLGLDLGAMAPATKSTETLTAKAFTPDGPGKRLIAHELTHVVQQRAGR